MDAPVVVSTAGLDALRQRRTSLRAAMGVFEFALAMPASGRIPVWRDAVGRAAVEVQGQWREHVGSTEGPDGFHAEILAAAPRLANAVERLIGDHVAVGEDVALILTRVPAVQTAQDVESIRELGTDVISRLARHRQRGADLIYEAYEYDLGGED